MRITGRGMPRLKMWTDGTWSGCIGVGAAQGRIWGARSAREAYDLLIGQIPELEFIERRVTAGDDLVDAGVVLTPEPPQMSRLAH